MVWVPLKQGDFRVSTVKSNKYELEVNMTNLDMVLWPVTQNVIDVAFVINCYIQPSVKEIKVNIPFITACKLSILSILIIIHE